MRVRAIIIENGRLLLIRRQKGGEQYWVFPGGGVETSDASLTAALQREALEELGLELEVGEQIVQIPSNDAAATEPQSFFLCRIVGGVLGSGTGEEWKRSQVDNVYELQWVPISEVQGIELRPAELKATLLRLVS